MNKQNEVNNLFFFLKLSFFNKIKGDLIDPNEPTSDRSFLLGEIKTTNTKKAMMDLSNQIIEEYTNPQENKKEKFQRVISKFLSSLKLLTKISFFFER